MGDNTGIEWTDATWNPVTGCSKVSQGCKFCYAERIFQRPYPGRDFTDVRTHPDRLEWPMRKRGRRIFVNSMSDLFHEKVPFDFIQRVFSVMGETPQHSYQVLTKRPERMLEFTQWLAGHDHISIAEWPRNVWLGVSVEDQATADERIPILLQAPAAVRFVSYEPALGPVDFRKFLGGRIPAGIPIEATAEMWGRDGVGWIIAGGESGPQARFHHPRWFRDVRDQCTAAGVPFFFKQWGEWAPTGHGDDVQRVGKRAAGRQLDGREWNEFPQQG